MEIYIYRIPKQTLGELGLILEKARLEQIFLNFAKIVYLSFVDTPENRFTLIHLDNGECFATTDHYKKLIIDNFFSSRLPKTTSDQSFWKEDKQCIGI